LEQDLSFVKLGLDPESNEKGFIFSRKDLSTFFLKRDAK